MRVSIVITNHNYERFLADAIESALGQRHTDCEVILVDDGSTDGSMAVVKRYPDVKPVVQANLGQAAAFNAGFERASGDAVIFLDADDMLAPNSARMVAETLEREPLVTKVMYRLRVVDETGSPTGELKPPAHLPLRSGDLRPHVLRFPFDMTWMATSGNGFRTTALTQIFPVPATDYPLCADYYLSHLTPLLGEVVFLDCVGGSYRVHPTNNYERAVGQLDLSQIRQSIVYCRRTARHLVELAENLDLPDRPAAVDEVLSVSEIYQRLVSLRLDPERHPLEGETRLRLLEAGLTAARRRFDVAPPLRALFAVWVTAVALAPRATLPGLLRLLALPQAGGRIGALLGRMHRG